MVKFYEDTETRGQSYTKRGEGCGFKVECWGVRAEQLAPWQRLLGVRERAVQVPGRDLQNGALRIRAWRCGW